MPVCIDPIMRIGEMSLAPRMLGYWEGVQLYALIHEGRHLTACIYPAVGKHPRSSASEPFPGQIWQQPSIQYIFYETVLDSTQRQCPKPSLPYMHFMLPYDRLASLAMLSTCQHMLIVGTI